jgi:hypothetical protein
MNFKRFDYWFFTARKLAKVTFSLSQVRGPKCANRYYSIKLPSQQVKILRGGFQGFAELYSDNFELVENYDQSYWDDPY